MSAEILMRGVELLHELGYSAYFDANPSISSSGCDTKYKLSFVGDKRNVYLELDTGKGYSIADILNVCDRLIAKHDPTYIFKALEAIELARCELHKAELSIETGEILL